MSTQVEEQLNQYYAGEKIAVQSFHCDHWKCCSDAAKTTDLVKGCEAYLGSSFGDPFRLVFLALDRGYVPGNKATGLTIEQRRAEVEATDVFPKDLHMRGTLKTLQHLLGNDYGAEIWKHFAMVNLAKCSRRTNMEQVPQTLYDLCSPFAGGELQILKPEILVTQGTRAKEYVASRDDWQPTQVAEDLQREVSVGWEERRDLLAAIFQKRRYVQRLCIEGSWVVWISHTVHPSAWRGNAWEEFRKVYLQVVCEIACALLQRIRTVTC